MNSPPGFQTIMRKAITIACTHDGKEIVLMPTSTPIHEQKAAMQAMLAERAANPVHEKFAWVRYQELESNWSGGEARVITFEKPAPKKK